MNTLDTSRINPRPIDEIIASVRTGKMPKGGGFTEVDGGLAAIDAVAARIQHGVIHLLPELKRTVDQEGNINGDSVIVYQTESGLVRYLGFKVVTATADWIQSIPGVYPPRKAALNGGRVFLGIDRLTFGDFEADGLVGSGAIATKRRIKKVKQR